MDDHRKRLFAEADIFYQIPGAFGMAWGTTGLKLLRRMQYLLNARLKDLEFEEIQLPLIGDISSLRAYLGDKAEMLIETKLDASRHYALLPFSDLLYAAHLEANFPTSGPPLPSKAYMWSRCFLAENTERFLDFGEYAKCEIFSIQKHETESISLWEGVNACLISFLEKDLNLMTFSGNRPPLSLFPMAERSFVSEIVLDEGLFQTAAVSHFMKADYLSVNGFASLAGRHFTSACLSQKLVASTLIHHRDESGFRIPPALSPVLGILTGVTPSEIDCKVLERLGGLDRLCFTQTLNRREIEGRLDKSETVWVLEKYYINHGTNEWILHVRGKGASTYPDIFSATEAAVRSVAILGRHLTRQSETKSRQALAMAENDDGSGPNTCRPCCKELECYGKIVACDLGIPILHFDVSESRPCGICGKDTRRRMLFEREEAYTSFYSNTSNKKVSS